MRTMALTLCCVLLTGCSLIDVGIGRGEQEWSVEGWGDAFANVGWRANDHLIHVELFGGYNAGTLISIEIWRINHIEIGLIGVSLGLGPLNAGFGTLFYQPGPPPVITGMNPFVYDAKPVGQDQDDGDASDG